VPNDIRQMSTNKNLGCFMIQAALLILCVLSITYGVTLNEGALIFLGGGIASALGTNMCISSFRKHGMCMENNAEDPAVIVQNPISSDPKIVVFQESREVFTRNSDPINVV
jgi:hypothetical protein